MPVDSELAQCSCLVRLVLAKCEVFRRKRMEKNGKEWTRRDLNPRPHAIERLLSMRATSCATSPM
jgi:hypothetical protein